MSSYDWIWLLHIKGLKATRHRLAVLNCFASDNLGLTHQDIQGIIGNEMDRVSLYRILALFTDKLILFRLSDALGNCYYILNRQQEGPEVFWALVKCQQCHRVTTLPQPPDAYIQLLKTHHIQPYILFNGLCEQCNHD